jgi:hypothetical protein
MLLYLTIHLFQLFLFFALKVIDQLKLFFQLLILLLTFGFISLHLMKGRHLFTQILLMHISSPYRIVHLLLHTINFVCDLLMPLNMFLSLLFRFQFCLYFRQNLINFLHLIPKIKCGLIGRILRVEIYITALWNIVWFILCFFIMVSVKSHDFSK